MDAPSTQLHLEIRDAVVRALATRRPILHHLNADTSWLLQIPRPANAVKHGARIYYNVLIDPWFVGGQSDVAKWFSQQWHATESAVKSISEVEELARQVEILAGGLGVGRSRKRKVEAVEDEESYVDCVAISHEFTDHCHKETLLEVHGDVPVFATEVRNLFFLNWERKVLQKGKGLRTTIASRQTHLVLEPFPHRSHDAHLCRPLRLARLQSLAAALMARHLPPHRHRRLALLPLRPPLHLRHAPFSLQHNAQEAPVYPEHQRRRWRRPAFFHRYRRSCRMRPLHSAWYTAYSTLPHRHRRPPFTHARVSPRPACRLPLGSATTQSRSEKRRPGAAHLARQVLGWHARRGQEGGWAGQLVFAQKSVDARGCVEGSGCE